MVPSNNRAIRWSFVLVLIALVSTTVPADNWFTNMLTDTALRSSGVDPSSEAAEMAKDVGTSWLNPTADDEEISEDIDRIKSYVEEEKDAEQLREIYHDKRLSALEKRQRIVNILDDVKVCSVGDRYFPVDYLFCPYHGNRLQSRSAVSYKPSPFSYLRSVLSGYTGGIQLGMLMHEARQRIEELGIDDEYESPGYYNAESYGDWMIRIWAEEGIETIEYMHYGENDGYDEFKKLIHETREHIGPPGKTKSGGNTQIWNTSSHGSEYTFRVFWVTAGADYCGVRLSRK